MSRIIIALLNQTIFFLELRNFPTRAIPQKSLVTRSHAHELTEAPSALLTIQATSASSKNRNSRSNRSGNRTSGTQDECVLCAYPLPLKPKEIYLLPLLRRVYLQGLYHRPTMCSYHWYRCRETNQRQQRRGTGIYDDAPFGTDLCMPILSCGTSRN